MNDDSNAPLFRFRQSAPIAKLNSTEKEIDIVAGRMSSLGAINPILLEYRTSSGKIAKLITK